MGQAKPPTVPLRWAGTGSRSAPFLCFHTRGSRPPLWGWGQPEGAHRMPNHMPQLWETGSKHLIRSVPVTEKMSQATGIRRRGGSPLIRACSSYFGESATIIHTRQRKWIYSQCCLMSRCFQKAATVSRFAEVMLLCRGRCWDRGHTAGEEAEAPG